MLCPVLLKDGIQSEMRTVHVRATVSPYGTTSLCQLSYVLLYLFPYIFTYTAQKMGTSTWHLLLELKEHVSGIVVVHAKFSKTYLYSWIQNNVFVYLNNAI
jgi:hypothetical protein